MAKRTGRLAGFEVYRGKGRRARRVGVAKGDSVQSLYDLASSRRRRGGEAIWHDQAESGAASRSLKHHGAT